MATFQALIIYGDGMQALCYAEKNVRLTRQGVRVRPLLVVPSEELKKGYNLEENDLPIICDDSRRGIEMEYPIQQIDWLNKSKTGAVLLIWCAFDGSDTLLMRKMDELLEWDEHRDLTEARLRAQVSLLQKELEDVTSNQLELLKKQKEYQEAAGSTNKPGREEEYNSNAGGPQ